MAGAVNFTRAEAASNQAILSKDRLLREFLEGHRLDTAVDSLEWFNYLAAIKSILGNLNNDLSFVATLLIKEYLKERFAVSDFDAGAKPQGAPGIDIEAKLADGRRVVAELKTTTPYQPGFGAAQRTSILKDLDRLAKVSADYRIMFVTDADAFRTICGKGFSSRAPGVEIVNLLSGEKYLCT